jgi:integrase
MEIILGRFKNNKVFICAFLTACYTGMRTGEVFALTWNDIDLDNRIIKINKTVYAKDKEENGRWYLGTTKTIGSQREIYICDTLYSFLLKYKELQNNYKKEFGKNYKYYILEEVKNKYGKLVEYKIIKSNSKLNRAEMVFTRKDGTYSGTDIVRYPFRIIHHELGIKCRFYDLRGSFATVSLRNGCKIKDIAEVLGHKRIETTEKYYISSTNEDQINVVMQFDKNRTNI